MTHEPDPSGGVCRCTRCAAMAALRAALDEGEQSPVVEDYSLERVLAKIDRATR